MSNARDDLASLRVAVERRVGEDDFMERLRRIIAEDRDLLDRLAK